MHTVTRFVESQQHYDEEINHIHKFKLNGKEVTLACTQSDSSIPPEYYQHMEIALNGKEIHAADRILDYEIKDKWLLVHSATEYDRTSFTCLIDIETHDSRFLTQVGFGWYPTDFTKNDYMCNVDFEKEIVTFTHDGEIRTFANVFKCSRDRVIYVGDKPIPLQ